MHTPTATSVQRALNAFLNGNQCPGAGALGECAATIPLHSDDDGWHEACIYIHDSAFNDSAALAAVAAKAGALWISVAHTLHDAGSFIQAGVSQVDRTREWTMTYWIPPTGSECPVQEGERRGMRPGREPDAEAGAPLVPADRSSIEQAWQPGETGTEHTSTATSAQ